MKNAIFTLALFLAFSFTSSAQKGKWVELFNGKNLEGWKISENPSSFSVVDGTIKIDGPRAHAFYDGPVGNHDFKRSLIAARATIANMKPTPEPKP